VKYNVVLVDPAHYKLAHLLTDICRTIAYGLRDLGLECDLSVNSIDNESTNILIGTHLLSESDISGIIGSGVPYIAMQSEWVYRDPQTGAICSSFQGAQFETIARPLMEHAVAVWDGLTDVVLLRQLCVPDERVKRFRMGYCQGLEDIEQRPYDRKDVDALFFGSITPHRAAILSSLTGMRTATFEYGPSAFRNELIARSKINLALHSTPELGYFPQPRAAYVLNNKGLVVAEPSVDHPAMRDLVAEAPAAELRDLCAQLLANPAELKNQAEAAYEGYRHLRMADVLSELL
jgi:hypothetical protein